MGNTKQLEMINNIDFNLLVDYISTILCCSKVDALKLIRITVKNIGSNEIAVYDGLYDLCDQKKTGRVASI